MVLKQFTYEVFKQLIQSLTIKSINKERYRERKKERKKQQTNNASDNILYKFCPVFQ